MKHSPQFVNKLHAIYEPRYLITTFTRSGHFSLSRSTEIKLNPTHPNSLRFLLTVSKNEYQEISWE
jgi:hypothetical protein